MGSNPIFITFFSLGITSSSFPYLPKVDFLHLKIRAKNNICFIKFLQRLSNHSYHYHYHHHIHVPVVTIKYSFFNRTNYFPHQPIFQFLQIFLLRYNLLAIKFTFSKVYNSVSFTIFTKLCKHLNSRKFLSFRKETLSSLAVTLYSFVCSPSPRQP